MLQSPPRSIEPPERLVNETLDPEPPQALWPNPKLQSQSPKSFVCSRKLIKGKGLGTANREPKECRYEYEIGICLHGSSYSFSVPTIFLGFPVLGPASESVQTGTSAIWPLMGASMAS